METTIVKPDRPPICIWLGIILALYLFMSIAAIICVHLDFLKMLGGAKLLKAHVMCGGFGMLGAAVASIRKYYRTLITETAALETGQPGAPVVWDLGWVYYYVTRPILGGVLGALTFTLSFVGLHILATGSKIDISPEGRFLLYGVAFLSGFSTSRVLDKLNAVAKQVFHVGEQNKGEEK